MLKVLLFDDSNEDDKEKYLYAEKGHDAFIAIGDITRKIRNITKYPEELYALVEKEAIESPPDDSKLKVKNLSDREKYITELTAQVIYEKMWEAIAENNVEDGI